MGIAVRARRWTSGPPERVWELVGRASNWPQWSLAKNASLEREGSPDPDGVGAIRRLSTGPGGTREEVITWEPPRLLEYRVLSGLPIVDHRATLTLTANEGGTDIDWRATFDVRRRWMAPMMKAFLSASMWALARGLAKKAAA